MSPKRADSTRSYITHHAAVCNWRRKIDWPAMHSNIAGTRTQSTQESKKLQIREACFIYDTWQISNLDKMQKDDTIELHERRTDSGSSE